MARAVASEHPPLAPRAGWRLVAAKELADHLLSARFAVLLILLGLAVAGTVYAAATGIRDVAPEATGTPALFLRLFTVSPGERVPAFFGLVGFLAPLLGIAFGFDAVNSERSQGTLPRLLSQPIHRDDVVNGKFAAGLAVIALILGGITMLVAGLGMLRLGIVPTTSEVLRILAWLALAVVYVGFWLAFASLLSVVVERAATAALVAIAAWLVLTLFFGLLVGLVADGLAPVPEQATAGEVIRNIQLQLNLARLSPSTLYEEATIVLLNPEVRTLTPAFLLLPEQIDRAVRGTLPLTQSLLLIWPQVVGLVALTILCFAAAYVSFMRQEVRA
ncbi:MAG: ABC transporter permease [Acidimicrobiia bacterium]